MNLNLFARQACAVGVCLFGLSGCTTDSGSGDFAAGDSESDTVVRSQGGEAQGDITMNELEREAHEAIAAADEFTAQKAAEYRQQVEQRLSKIETHVNELKRLTSETTREIKPEVRQLFEKMEQKIADTRATLQAQRDDTAEAWQELRTGVDSAISELEQSAEKVSQQMSTETESTRASDGDVSTTNEGGREAGEDATSNQQDTGDSAVRQP